jgi:hypothetical protein
LSGLTARFYNFIGSHPVWFGAISPSYLVFRAKTPLWLPVTPLRDTTSFLLPASTTRTDHPWLVNVLYPLYVPFLCLLHSLRLSFTFLFLFDSSNPPTQPKKKIQKTAEQVKNIQKTDMKTDFRLELTDNDAKTTKTSTKRHSKIVTDHKSHRRQGRKRGYKAACAGGKFIEYCVVSPLFFFLSFSFFLPCVGNNLLLGSFHGRSEF